MGVRKSVFASKAERKAFEHLSRNWGERYRLYHNLPFLNVFDIGNLIEWTGSSLRQITVDSIDLSRLKKTSIDFTLCDEADAPLVCIEFDGLCDGFNVGNEYHTEYPPDGPWREIIMNLKLKVAHGSLFPYFVMGSPQFERLSKVAEVAIVDGVIGDVLAHKAASERIRNGFKPDEVGMSQDDFDELSPPQQHELIQDWVFGVEIEADFEHNPIYRACAALADQLHVLGHSVKWLEYPSADGAKTIAERRELLDKARLIGSTVTVKHPTLGEKSATLMLPNFKTLGASPLTLFEEIAHFLALDQLREGEI